MTSRNNGLISAIISQRINFQLLNLDDPKFIPYKILHDYLARECILRARFYKILQDSKFFASLLQDKHFLFLIFLSYNL